MATVDKQSALAFPISNSRYLGKIHVEGTPDLHDRQETYVIFVLDHSGSMGDASNEFIANIDNLMKSMNLTQAALIIFTSDVKTMRSSQGYFMTSQEFQRVYLGSQGSTMFAHVPEQLGHILETIPVDAKCDIIVISDGDIHDSDMSNSNINTFVSRYRDRPGTINVSLLQYRDMGEVKALACLARLNTTPDLPYVCGSTMTELMANGITMFNECNIPTASLRSSTKCLMRYPGMSHVDELRLPMGNVGFFYIMTENLDDMRINLDGINVELIKAPLMGDQIQSHLNDLLQYTARSTLTKDSYIIDAIKEMVGDIHQILLANDVTVGVADGMSTSTRNRLANFIRKRAVDDKSMAARILQICNMDLVNQLNQRQAGEFLREIKAGRAGVSLAKRAVRAGGDQAGDMGPGQFTKILTIIKNLSQIDFPPSFYSQEGSADVINSIITNFDDINTLDVPEVLRLVGMTGYPITFPQYDYPDPWQILYTKLNVYHSDLHLSQQDHREMVSHGGELPRHPYDREFKITGVIPTIGLNGELYKAIAKSNLGQMHASLTLRGLVACVPYDVLALLAATTISECAKIGQKERPSDIEIKSIWDLLDTLSYHLDSVKKSFDELFRAIISPDPRGYFTGGNGIASVLKPLMMILSSKDCRDMRQDRRLIIKFLMDVYQLDCYYRIKWEYKSQEELRHVHIKELLKYIPQDTSDGEFDPTSVEHPDIPYALTLTILPKSVIPDNYMAFVRIALSVNNQTLIPLEADDIFDIFSGEIQIISILMALSQSKESDRVLDGKPQTPQLSDIEACREYIRNLQLSIYRQDHEKRVRDAEAARREMLLQAQVDTLCSISNADIFSRFIVEINCNRSDAVLIRFVECLFDLSKPVSIRAEKIRIYVLGKNGEMDVIKGGSLRAPTQMRRLADVYKKCGGPDWDRIIEIHRSLKGQHIYRDSMTSRHGYCNLHPSWESMGFDSEDLFRDTIGPIEYTKYCDLRREYNLLKWSPSRSSLKTGWGPLRERWFKYLRENPDKIPRV